MCNSSMILKVMIVIRCHIFIDKKYCFIGQHRTFATFYDNCDIYMPLVGFMNLLWHYTKTQIYIPCNYYLISLLFFVAGERERERERWRGMYMRTLKNNQNWRREKHFYLDVRTICFSPNGDLALRRRNKRIIERLCW